MIASPFIPLNRISTGGLGYVVPLVQPKITGLIVAEENSSFLFDGKEVYIGDTIPYAKRPVSNYAVEFADQSLEKAQIDAASTKGRLLVRSINSDQITLSDEAGDEVVVPLRINGNDEQEGSSEASLRVRLDTHVRIGVILDEGRQIVCSLPPNVAEKNLCTVTTRQGTRRLLQLDRRDGQLTYFRVEGKPLVPLQQTPEVKARYALTIRSGGAGVELMNFPLDPDPGTAVPRNNSYDAKLLAGASVWQDGHFQGFVDSNGRWVKVSPQNSEKCDVGIVIFSITQNKK